MYNVSFNSLFDSRDFALLFLQERAKGNRRPSRDISSASNVSMQFAWMFLWGENCCLGYTREQNRVTRLDFFLTS